MKMLSGSFSVLKQILQTSVIYQIFIRPCVGVGVYYI